MFDGLDTSVQGLFIAPCDLVHWAERIRPHAERMAAGSGGRYLAADLFAALAAGRMLLWVGVQGADILCVMLTEIVQYPQKRAMRCVAIVGHQSRRWTHLLASVEESARVRFGCDLMEALHPQRLGRLLRTGGWRQFHILSEKTL